MHWFLSQMDKLRFSRHSKTFRRVMVVLLLVLFLIFTPIEVFIQGQPTHSAAPIEVTGEGKLITVTVKVTASENGSYRVQISQIENVTLKFVLLTNGTSDTKVLGASESYDFKIQMKTRTAAMATKTSVPYQIYENEVLVATGSVVINVKAPKEPTSDLNCDTCGLIIPLIITGGIFVVKKGKWKGRLEE